MPNPGGSLPTAGANSSGSPGIPTLPSFQAMQPPSQSMEQHLHQENSLFGSQGGLEEQNLSGKSQFAELGGLKGGGS